MECTFEEEMTSRKRTLAKELDLGMLLRARLYAVRELSRSAPATPRQAALIQLMQLLSKRWQLPPTEAFGADEGEGWTALRASEGKRDELLTAYDARASAAKAALVALRAYVDASVLCVPAPHLPKQLATWREEERIAVERVLGIMAATTTTRTPLQETLEWALGKPVGVFEWQRILYREGVTARELGLVAICAGYEPFPTTRLLHELDETKVVEAAAKAARKQASKLPETHYRRPLPDSRRAARKRKPTG
jgi:hypothetical protein